MRLRPRIRVFQKVRLAAGRWQFVSLPRKGNSWIWDPRPGTYSIEWWEGPQRRRESAGSTPAEALNAVRRKQWELAGQAVTGDPGGNAVEPDAAVTCFVTISLDTDLPMRQRLSSERAIRTGCSSLPGLDGASGWFGRDASASAAGFLAGAAAADSGGSGFR